LEPSSLNEKKLKKYYYNSNLYSTYTKIRFKKGLKYS
jgi:hypothetical protein